MRRFLQPLARVILVATPVALAAAAAYLWWAPRPPGGQPDGPHSAAIAVADGPALFSSQCAGCHGERGDGAGPAASFLYPRPRNFGEAKFRIVTTTNNLPSDDDLKAVIRNGMPGSAMVGFAHLGDEAIAALVGQVRLRIRDGVERQLREQAARSGEKLADAEVAEIVGEAVTVGGLLAVPASLPATSAESVARGAVLFRSTRTGCAACHGDQGKGDGVQAQRNTDGTPTRPRDLTRGIYKGSRDPGQLYARIARGLPGSPMPAATGLQDSEIGDIINFVLSLSPPEATARLEYHRRKVVARKCAELPDEPLAAAWRGSQATPMTVTPLWWRDHESPDLRVDALHDGKGVAIRLSWHDPSRDDRADRTERFEDMAAVELTRSRPEPFLGMGGPTAALDLWLWRASREAKRPETLGPLDDYPFESPNYAEMAQGKPAGDVPNFLTARAAGNPHAAGGSASDLTAKGHGSTTFLPKASQRVAARASWSDGRWSVVLRRPLAVPDGGGISLVAGEKYSVAFALWDGAARDRAGQKLISIWHDLVLE